MTARTADAPPDGGYGWVVVFACAVLNAFTWGVTSSFSIYLTEYLSNDYFPGATPLDFGFVGGFNFAFAMLTAPCITYLTRELGGHAVILIGGVLQCLGYTMASISSRIWQLYLTQGVLVGCGIGFIIVPSMPMVSQWFVRKRSMANGISSAGSGLGGVLFTWGTAAMLQKVGLPWTLRATGLVTIVAIAVATILLRDRNCVIRPTQLAFDITLLKRLDVVLLLAWAFVSMFGYITLLFSLSDFSISIGLSSQQSIVVAGLLNLGTAVGRPMIGVLSDTTSRPMVAGSLTLLTGLLCFILWLPSTSFALTSVFAIISGATLGVFWMTIGPLCTEVAGLENLPSLMSLAWAAVIIPTACAEPIALALRRSNASLPYAYVQTFAGIAYIVGSIFMLGLFLLLRRRRS